MSGTIQNDSDTICADPNHSFWLYCDLEVLGCFAFFVWVFFCCLFLRSEICLSPEWYNLQEDSAYVEVDNIDASRCWILLGIQVSIKSFIRKLNSHFSLFQSVYSRYLIFSIAKPGMKALGERNYLQTAFSTFPQPFLISDSCYLLLAVSPPQWICSH